MILEMRLNHEEHEDREEKLRLSPLMDAALLMRVRKHSIENLRALRVLRGEMFFIATFKT
jgi:hypothetical protein